MAIKLLPPEYNKKFKSLYNRFDYILSDIKKTYPKHKLQPNNVEYSNEYSQDLTNLQNIKDTIQKYYSDLQTDINTIRMDINNKNTLITKINKENKQLRDNLINFENSDYAAGGELIIKKQMYNQIIIQNIILLTIITGSIFYYRN